MQNSLFNISVSISAVIKDIFIPLFAVFLGAVFAHYFNIWYDKKNTFDKNKSKLIYLHNKLLTIYMDLKICNKIVNDKINLLENNKLNEIVNNTITTTYGINIKFEEFNFLLMYNKLFVVMIQILNDRLGELNIYLSDYNKYSENIRLNWRKNIELELQVTSQVNTYLNEIRNFSEDLLGILHILLQGLDLCYQKYFNNKFDYYDLSSNYLEDSFFSENKLYISNLKSFNNAWLPIRNIQDDLKILKCRFKQKIYDIKTYLMLEGK